jgi:hypothetical protein
VQASRGIHKKFDPLATDRQLLRLFLCGDVMCGRGIDQVQAQPGDLQGLLAIGAGRFVKEWIAY